MMLRNQYFHFFSWLLAGNSYMVTLWWCLTYTLIYLLVTRPPLTILTWPLESRWLFTNTFTQAQFAVDSELHLYLFIVLHDSFLIMHDWSAYCSRWLGTAHYCTLLRIVTYCDAYCSRYPIVLLQYISQSAGSLLPQTWLLSSYCNCTLVAANRLRSPLPSCLIPLKVIHCNVLKWHALVNYFSSETI